MVTVSCLPNRESSGSSSSICFSGFTFVSLAPELERHERKWLEWLEVESEFKNKIKLRIENHIKSNKNNFTSCQIRQVEHIISKTCMIEKG